MSVLATERKVDGPLRYLDNTKALALWVVDKDLASCDVDISSSVGGDAFTSVLRK